MYKGENAKFYLFAQEDWDRRNEKSFFPQITSIKNDDVNHVNGCGLEFNETTSFQEPYDRKYIISLKNININYKGFLVFVIEYENKFYSFFDLKWYGKEYNSVYGLNHKNIYLKADYFHKEKFNDHELFCFINKNKLFNSNYKEIKLKEFRKSIDEIRINFNENVKILIDDLFDKSNEEFSIIDKIDQFMKYSKCRKEAFTKEINKVVKEYKQKEMPTK